MKGISATLLAASLVTGLFAPGPVWAEAEPRSAAPPAPEFAPVEPLPAAPPPTPPRAPADVAEAPADAQTTASGLASRVLVKGSGAGRPAAFDHVVINYTAWTPDGKVFDSSVPRGAPTKVPLDTLVSGWSEGVRLMAKGEKRRLWIPAALTTGGRSDRPRTLAGPLVVDVELVDFTKMLEPPTVPEDVEAVPKDAKRTPSGLAYKLLKRGKGKEHPKPDSAVEVHYSGWTPDGKLFDSSVLRGKPVSFGLDGVIKGWTEGLQLMTVGDKARFWIPGKLAYGDKPRPGAPAGNLVFDVELLGIK